eukprot:PhF_6_TR13210/c0_g1_i1/m.20877
MPSQGLILSKVEKNYVGGIGRCLNHPAVLGNALQLATTLKAGGGSLTPENGTTGLQYWSYHMLHSGDAVEGILVNTLYKVIQKETPNALTLLDVGCGSGYVSKHLSQKMTSAHFTLTDFPHVLRGITDVPLTQFRLLPMDFLRDLCPPNAFPTPSQQLHDIVLLINFLEHFSDMEVKAMVWRCWKEFSRPQTVMIVGTPVVPGKNKVDMFTPMPHTFNLLLYTFTPQGRVRSEEEWVSLLVGDKGDIRVDVVRMTP